MLNETTFRRKMADMKSSLPIREGSDPESTHRVLVYHRGLRDLDDDAYVEACDRILFTDEWFPTIARIRAVAGECRRDRAVREQANSGRVAPRKLVCATCHGSRWIRLGGYDPLHVKAGDEGSRTQSCPSCTINGKYDADAERRAIMIEGGVPNPDVNREIDMSTVTWPARMAAMRDPQTGKIDMEQLYRLSRELRGLDPLVDERPANIAGWKAAGSVAAREMVPA